ncbi:hypothetical protein P154DRAFT_530258 [Amniculicola lignicola CBS 123094]|uniref:Uncharacterized protein n=1 Tax=Amniculicola lignicola CBS 123094 TaxID=1392246 RepID=A0A6A5X2N5_9PLEO|nr:hypothetical protein P154DRAFT_530258 [Amniculicola lignicola CBS 123094]
MLDEKLMQRTELTAENLKAHELSCPNTNECFHVRLIQAERASVAERAMHQALFGNVAKEDESLEAGSEDLARCIEKSLNPLKLYTGTYSSSEMPLNRFLAISPSQDPHPWLAKTTLDECGISAGNLEAVHVRQTATQMVVDNDLGTQSSPESMGTPRPSSDALPDAPSVSALREMRAMRKDRARVRKRVGFRRRRQDVEKAARMPVILHQRNDDVDG